MGLLSTVQFLPDIGAHLVAADLQDKAHLVLDEGLGLLEHPFVGGAQLLARRAQRPLALLDAQGQADQVPQVAVLYDLLESGSIQGNWIPFVDRIS